MSIKKPSNFSLLAAAMAKGQPGSVRPGGYGAARGQRAMVIAAPKGKSQMLAGPGSVDGLRPGMESKRKPPLSMAG